MTRSTSNRRATSMRMPRYAPWEHQNAWNRGRTRHLLGVLLGCKLWESKALVHVYAAQCMSIHRRHRA